MKLNKKYLYVVKTNWQLEKGLSDYTSKKMSILYQKFLACYMILKLGIVMNRN